MNDEPSVAVHFARLIDARHPTAGEATVHTRGEPPRIARLGVAAIMVPVDADPDARREHARNLLQLRATSRRLGYG